MINQLSRFKVTLLGLSVRRYYTTFLVIRTQWSSGRDQSSVGFETKLNYKGSGNRRIFI